MAEVARRWPDSLFYFSVDDNAESQIIKLQQAAKRYRAYDEAATVDSNGDTFQDILQGVSLGSLSTLRERFRVYHDSTNNRFLIQYNSGSDASPSWSTLLRVDSNGNTIIDGDVTVDALDTSGVLTLGGKLDANGFYIVNAGSIVASTIESPRIEGDIDMQGNDLLNVGSIDMDGDVDMNLNDIIDAGSVTLGNREWQFYVNDQSDLVLRQNTGTPGSPTWATRDMFLSGSGLKYGWEYLGEHQTLFTTFLDIKSRITSEFNTYAIWVEVATFLDSKNLCIQVSTDNGATFKAGASDYEYANFGVFSDGNTAVKASTGDTQMFLTSDAAGKEMEADSHLHGWVNILSAGSVTSNCRISSDVTYLSDGGHMGNVRGGGEYTTDGRINAIRFRLDDGTAIACTAIIYGMRDPTI